MKGQLATLRLRVVPGARRAGVVGRHGDAWKLRVIAHAEDGRANEAVLTLLAETLDVSRASLELSSGRSSRDKLVVVGGITVETAEERLSVAAARA